MWTNSNMREDKISTLAEGQAHGSVNEKLNTYGKTSQRKHLIRDFKINRISAGQKVRKASADGKNSINKGTEQGKYRAERPLCPQQRIYEEGLWLEIKPIWVWGTGEWGVWIFVYSSVPLYLLCSAVSPVLFFMRTFTKSAFIFLEYLYFKRKFTITPVNSKPILLALNKSRKLNTVIKF